MKRLNLVILAVGAASAWYLRRQLSQLDDSYSVQDAPEYISQGSSFFNLASLGKELEHLQYVIAESLPIFIGAFAIMGILIYIQLFQKGLEQKPSAPETDELLD